MHNFLTPALSESVYLCLGTEAREGPTSLTRPSYRGYPMPYPQTLTASRWTVFQVRYVRLTPRHTAHVTLLLTEAGDYGLALAGLTAERFLKNGQHPLIDCIFWIFGKSTSEKLKKEKILFGCRPVPAYAGGCNTSLSKES